MRRVRVSVVLECGGQWEGAWARPVAAFESRELAERCADARERREAMAREVAFGPWLLDLMHRAESLAWEDVMRIDWGCRDVAR